MNEGFLTWPDAKVAAEALPECCGSKAHLATISSQGENTYLFDLAARPVTFNCGEGRRRPEEIDPERQLQFGPNTCEGWIGLSYVDFLAFEWVTSEPFPGPYTNWGLGFTPGDGNNYPYVHMFFNDGRWYNANNDTLAYYFAEYDCGAE